MIVHACVNEAAENLRHEETMDALVFALQVKTRLEVKVKNFWHKWVPGSFLS